MGHKRLPLENGATPAPPSNCLQDFRVSKSKSRIDGLCLTQPWPKKRSKKGQKAQQEAAIAVESLSLSRDSSSNIYSLINAQIDCSGEKTQIVPNTRRTTSMVYSRSFQTTHRAKVTKLVAMTARPEKNNKSFQTRGGGGRRVMV